MLPSLLATSVRLDRKLPVATFENMRAVGLKVLKNKLSEYVRLAAGGETVLITDRDRVVAEIIPELPMKTADALILGKKLRVSGNYRYDAEGGCKQAKPSHCWHEVHPVRVLEIVQ